MELFDCGLRPGGAIWPTPRRDFGLRIADLILLGRKNVDVAQ